MPFPVARHGSGLVRRDKLGAMSWFRRRQRKRDDPDLGRPDDHL